MVKLAIIGTRESVNLINKIIDKNFEDITYCNLILDKVKIIKDIVDSIAKDVDGIFVTGMGVYFELLKYDLNVPISFAKHGSISLIKCLEQMRADDCLTQNAKISFDIISDTTIEDIICEFDYSIKDFYIEESSPEKNEDYYITKHLKLFYEKKIDYVVTSFGYIYSLFKGLELPVYRMFPSIIDLKNNIADLLLEIEISKLDKSKILVYRFKPMNCADVLDYKSPFTKFSKSIDAFVDFNEDNSITIISTKNYYNNRFSMALVSDFLKENKLNCFKAGIGSDISVKKALKNSQKALDEYDNNISYFDGLSFHHYDDGEKLHPLNLISNDDVLEIAQDTGIIPKRIHQLYDSMLKLNKYIFSSYEISEILGLSVRSANRIINSLVKNGYGEFIDNNIQNNIGRPKRFVKINFFN
ncbi:hypothetical protein [uncultured Finegoldia sp.]|uniref:hypothetical protein n=1 Tax=uncultured Finegoldia sp. TaxID=328009 RepID=UPI0026374B93|nr:hypothetical protein [uncultured Finegoldia sp.]